MGNGQRSRRQSALWEERIGKDMVNSMNTMAQREGVRDAAMAKRRIAAYWDGRSDSFMTQREEELHSEQRQIWEKELLSHLPEKEGLRILDVGCGCGFFSLILAEQNHAVTGIDLTESMIQQSRRLAKKYGSEAAFYRMDAEKLMFPDETFDVIVSRNLTWTLPHPREAYKEWIRVLKPGGILLNYDAEHARHHRSEGLEGEEAHRMLSQRQMDECMAIYDMLPISGWKRPDWDVVCLKQTGCSQVWVNRKMGEILFPHENQFRTPYPVFRVKAVKDHPCS